VCNTCRSTFISSHPSVSRDRHVSASIGKRIIVIGSSNAGKTTLAERLASRLGSSFIELDALHWEPHWTEADAEVFRERVRQAIAADSWVVDGNYSKQVDLSWPLADTVIWLDLPLHLVLRRCIRRTWRRYRDREVLYNGNREDFWEHMMLWSSEKSLITFTIKYHRSRRRRFEAALHDPRWSHINFIRLRSVQEVETWISTIGAAAS
jgi:adenylate kinase family enzyme